MSIEVTQEEHDALEGVRDLGGVEVHKDEWPLYEGLRDKGLVTLSSARGPDKLWRRAEAVSETIYPVVEVKK